MRCLTETGTTFAKKKKKTKKKQTDTGRMLTADLATEDGFTFRRTMSFFFAHRVLGLDVDSSLVLPVGPTLDRVKQFAEEKLKNPPPGKPEMYWNLIGALHLMLNSMTYHVHSAWRKKKKKTKKKNEKKRNKKQ